MCISEPPETYMQSLPAFGGFTCRRQVYLPKASLQAEVSYASCKG